ncbi:MAG TPA: hypothetical protein VFR15_09920 [Chloroflexia bacterium]|nr:hypothetical protein [Chloroflexia bacterium]
MVSTQGNSEPSAPSDGEPTRDLRGTTQSEQSVALAPPNTIRKDNITFDQSNPNVARAVRRRSAPTEVKVTYEEYLARVRRSEGPDLVEGSDSERTGTTWGLPGVDNWPTVLTPEGEMPEGYGPGRAEPNRNTGRRGMPDPTYMVGGWSTIDDNETRMSGGSPSGNA